MFMDTAGDQIVPSSNFWEMQVINNQHLILILIIKRFINIDHSDLY